MDIKEIALAFTSKSSKAENVVDFYKEYQKNLEELEAYKKSNAPKVKTANKNGMGIY